MNHKEFDKMMKEWLQKEIKSCEQSIEHCEDSVESAQYTQYFEGRKDAYEHCLNLFRTCYVTE